MGTRGLTAVFYDGAYRIAQYGQWDHYPDGQGLTALEFCREHLSTPDRRAEYAKCLSKVRFSMDPRELQASTVDGAPDGYPFAGRDHGAAILDLVREAPGEVVLRDQTTFAGDSLYCEWAYVVDLDKATLEVFKGFNRQPVDPSERFASLAKSDSDYAPVRHAATFSLDAAPSEEAFLATFDDGDDESEEGQS